MTTEQLRAVATQTAPRAKTILDYLDDSRVKNGLVAVATKYLTAERVLRLSNNAVRKTPKLLQCDPQTVLGAIMTSTALGLEPNTLLQQAFLIPYKRWMKNAQGKFVAVMECQFQIGYRGFVTLGYRSPHIKQIQFEAIHKGDLFESEQGSKTFLRYAKALDQRGDLIGSFSHVILANGLESACVLPLAEVHKIRSRSETYRTLTAAVEAAKNEAELAKAQQKLADTPWVLWLDDMAAKSAIKKHAKGLPIATQDAILAAADIDTAGDLGQANLRAMADPDLVRTIIEGEEEVPQLENEPAPNAEFIADLERGEVAAVQQQSEAKQDQAAKHAEPAPADSKAPAKG